MLWSKNYAPKANKILTEKIFLFRDKISDLGAPGDFFPCDEYFNGEFEMSILELSIENELKRSISASVKRKRSILTLPDVETKSSSIQFQSIYYSFPLPDIYNLPCRL
jgi:hypothetical protein